jgi:hypothetical protein
MNPQIFNENDLPFAELETIGLASGKQLLLNVDDLKALLSGRRTGMLQLQDLEAENISIKSLDAKLSLKHNENGKADLLIHPIYKRPVTPDFLDDQEAKLLEKGEVANLLKVTTDNKGNKKEVLVEYDPDTREFIVSDTEKIISPDMVNGEFLTAAQRENYRKGKEVQLPDGTKLNYTAADEHAIRSNRIALIASIVIDGGLTYMLYKGLNALFNQPRDEKDAEKLSPAYHNTLHDMQEQQASRPELKERSYTRNRSAR